MKMAVTLSPDRAFGAQSPLLVRLLTSPRNQSAGFPPAFGIPATHLAGWQKGRCTVFTPLQWVCAIRSGNWKLTSPLVRTLKRPEGRAPWHLFGRGGFTLIEIMVVVAIMGLIMALGLPSILSSMKKEGMRKGLSDIEDCCYNARGEAIMQNKTVSVVFHPLDKSFSVDNGGAGASVDKVSSSTLPAGVEFAMLDINLMDFGASDWCRVRFFPDGTSDEMTLVLHAKDQWRKLTLEFATGIPTVSEVDR